MGITALMRCFATQNILAPHQNLNIPKLKWIRFTDKFSNVDEFLYIQPTQRTLTYPEKVEEDFANLM